MRELNGISANGGAFAMTLHDDADPVPSFVASRWTEGGGFEPLGTPSAGSISFAVGITSDGASVLVRAVPVPPLETDYSMHFWNEGTGYGSAMDFGGQLEPALMSGDGACFVADAPSSSANRTTPMKWSGSGWVDLGPVQPVTFGLSSVSRAIDHAGTTIVGGTPRTSPIQLAWRWTPGGGMEDLGSLPTTLGFRRSGALGVSAGGEFIVGTSTIGYAGGFVDSAFLWTEGTGMLDLNEYLPTLGLDLTGWRLTRATGVSADGSVLVGMGEFNGVESAWVVSGVPAPGTLAALGAFSILTSRRRRRRRRPTRTLPQERSSS